MTFKTPQLLWLLTAFIPLIAYYAWKYRNASPTLGLLSCRKGIH